MSFDSKHVSIPKEDFKWILAIMRSYASENPKFYSTVLGGMSDPNGVHALLAKYDKPIEPKTVVENDRWSAGI